MQNNNFSNFLKQTWGRLRIPIISLFIFYHTSALVLWNCPPFPLYWSIVPFFTPYICYLGFWNQWKMFSHPKKFNIYLTADVSLKDGRVIEWNFPRMEALDIFTRTQKEPYRKWAHEYVNEEEYKVVLPDTCKFIARQVHNAEDEPVKVQLIRHYTWIQPPAGGGEAQPEGEFDYEFYSYDLKPEDLQ